MSNPSRIFAKYFIEFSMQRQKQLQDILNQPLSLEERLQRITQFLHQEVSYYNWVGFYFTNGDKEELVLGPFTGAATEHTHIPFGKGICGQVAVSNENFVVPDVNAQDNYLSCSLETRAEVVIPILSKGDNIGQIDIDSHTLNPFTKEDIEELEWLCQEIGDRWEA